MDNFWLDVRAKRLNFFGYLFLAICFLGLKKTIIRTSDFSTVV